MNLPFRQPDVVIVGGGLAGLSAAAIVARAGRSVVVLEQASSLGGRARTQERAGARFNLGAHALYCHGHAFRLLRNLGVPFTGRFPSPGRALAVLGDRLHTLPTGLGSLIFSRFLTLREKGTLLRFFTSANRLDPRPFDRVSVRDWITKTAGRGNLALLFRFLFRVSTYTDDPDRTSAGAVLDQLKLALAGNVWYLDGGWQTLIEGLRDLAVHHGARVLSGS